MGVSIGDWGLGLELRYPLLIGLASIPAPLCGTLTNWRTLTAIHPTPTTPSSTRDPDGLAHPDVATTRPTSPSAPGSPTALRRNGLFATPLRGCALQLRLRLRGSCAQRHRLAKITVVP